jgi:hypothetical protein
MRGEVVPSHVFNCVQDQLGAHFFSPARPHTLKSSKVSPEIKRPRRWRALRDSSYTESGRRVTIARPSHTLNMTGLRWDHPRPQAIRR